MKNLLLISVMFLSLSLSAQYKKKKSSVIKSEFYVPAITMGSTVMINNNFDFTTKQSRQLSLTGICTAGLTYAGIKCYKNNKKEIKSFFKRIFKRKKCYNYR